MADNKKVQHRIIVYRDVDFKGPSKEYTCSQPNLGAVGFNDCISSLIVHGNPWIAYDHKDFLGTYHIFEEGEYKTMPKWDLNDKVSSLRYVPGNMRNPQMTLYMDEDFQGESFTMTSITDLVNSDYYKKVKSHKLGGGAWVMYKSAEPKDNQTVAVVHELFNDTWANYDTFAKETRLYKPMKGGVNTVETIVHYDKKTEETKNVKIDTLFFLNNSSSIQTITKDNSKDYTTTNTTTFKFSNTTSAGVEVEVVLDAKLIKNSAKVTANTSFTFDTGKDTTKTETISQKITIPTVVSPFSKMTVNVVAKTIKVKIPVEVKINNQITWGELETEDGSTLNIEFEETKLSED